MANLNIRKLDPMLLHALRVQAGHHGVSMEEEARQILQRGIQAPVKIGDIAQRLFGNAQSIELGLPKRESHDPIDF